MVILIRTLFYPLFFFSDGRRCYVSNHGQNCEIMTCGEDVSMNVLITVRSTREGNVFSLFTPRRRGVPRPGPARWGVPQPGLMEGTPPRVSPHQTWMGVPWWGYPTLGTPHRTWVGGVWVPHLRYTLSDLGGGYPWQGVPEVGYPPPPCPGPMGGIPDVGYPLLDLGGIDLPHLGYPPVGPGQGVPHLRYPPHQTWAGGTLMGGYPTLARITDGVLDTPRSVCLLRSRRRTFLF